jgi:hypothetical protein
MPLLNDTDESLKGRGFVPITDIKEKTRLMALANVDPSLAGNTGVFQFTTIGATKDASGKDVAYKRTTYAILDQTSRTPTIDNAIEQTEFMAPNGKTVAGRLNVTLHYDASKGIKTLSVSGLNGKGATVNSSVAINPASGKGKDGVERGSSIDIERSATGRDANGEKQKTTEKETVDPTKSSDTMMQSAASNWEKAISAVKDTTVQFAKAAGSHGLDGVVTKQPSNDAGKGVA